MGFEKPSLFRNWSVIMLANPLEQLSLRSVPNLEFNRYSPVTAILKAMPIQNGLFGHSKKISDFEKALNRWQKEYNEDYPHSSLGYMTPYEYERWFQASAA